MITCCWTKKHYLITIISSKNVDLSNWALTQEARRKNDPGNCLCDNGTDQWYFVKYLLIISFPACHLWQYSFTCNPALEIVTPLWMSVYLTASKTKTHKAKYMSSSVTQLMYNLPIKSNIYKIMNTSAIGNKLKKSHKSDNISRDVLNNTQQIMYILRINSNNIYKIMNTFATGNKLNAHLFSLHGVSHDKLCHIAEMSHPCSMLQHTCLLTRYFRETMEIVLQ